MPQSESRILHGYHYLGDSLRVLFSTDEVVTEVLHYVLDPRVVEAGTYREPQEDGVEFLGNVRVDLSKVHDAVGKENRGVRFVEEARKLGLTLDGIPKGQEALTNNKMEEVAHTQDVKECVLLIQVKINPLVLACSRFHEEVVVPDVSWQRPAS
jgi:hypothetical protein